MKQEIIELNAAQLGTRDTARANAKASDQVMRIELSKIIVRDGFNVRQDMGDLEGLAYSILENGQTVPGRVDVLNDGTFVLTDGHRRFAAMKLLIEMGHQPFFSAIVNNSKTTEEQRILQMFTTQDNKQLAPYEVAELIKRLVNIGYNQTEVAKKIGKTAGYVSQMLEFANESPIIKQHVKNGDLNVSTALKIKKAIPTTNDRVEAVNKAINEKGCAKNITAEQVTGKKQNKAEEIAAAIIALIDIPDYKRNETKEDIINLLKKYI